MPKTRMNCPNCHQPVTAEIDQLIDVGQDPELKQKLLSGMVNYFQCPFCQFEGNLSTLVVYHDPDKELLLHYVPPEMGLSRDEQEKTIGNLINKVINNLPQEKRKAYLFNSRQTFTLQGLVERVLEADGITKEMIENQQQKIRLIQRLLEATPEKCSEIIEAEDKNIDEEFFILFRRLSEVALINQEEETAQKLSDIQKSLLNHSTYGKELQQRTMEIQEAVNELRGVGDNLTRDKLLEIMMNSHSDLRLRAFVSLTRPLIDYTFFQLLSDRIDRSRGEGRSRLVKLRDTLLELTSQYDKELAARRKISRDMITQLVTSIDVRESTSQLLPQIDEFFVRELENELELAQKEGDLERIGKLRQIESVIQEASAPPPEVELIEEMVGTESQEDLQKLIEDHGDEITPQFLEILSTFSSQIDASENPDLHKKLGEVNRAAVRFSMLKNMKA